MSLLDFVFNTVLNKPQFVARDQDRGLIGEIKAFAGFELPTGFLWCDGTNTLDANTYPALALAIGTAFNGGIQGYEVSTTNGSADIYFGWASPRFPAYLNPQMGDVFGLKNPEDFGLSAPVGLLYRPVFIVSATNIGGASPGPYQISLTPGGTPLVATASNTSPEGNNNLTLRFSVPDLRGRSPFGRDNMGGTDANRLTTLTSDGDLLGLTGGAESVTLTSAQSGMPAHTHVYTDRYRSVNSLPRGTGANLNAVGALDTVEDTTNAAAAQNAAQEHNNLPPLQIVNYIIRAL